MDDYFTLLGLPRSYIVSESELHKRYISLQRETHPDKLIGKDAEARAIAIQRSMRVNDAYDTLKSPLYRAEYLLELNGIFVNTDEDSVKPDKALLMEVMEIREQLSECDSGVALKAAMDDIKASMSRVIIELEGAFATQDYEHAAQLTMRLKYLGKSLEEAHTLFYRYKAEAEDTHAEDHTHH